MLLDGEELPEKTHEAVRAGVPWWPGRQLFPDMTVLGLNLGGWLCTRAECGEDPGVMNDFPSARARDQLAGTIAWRAADGPVARAMMSAPRLLMLDEPSWLAHGW